ncbi:hypothetical protein [Streptomyces purpurogeneiscleroticus]|uniref:hypothetical protein n=1 Tax=Streptomyces purpurogeneiscleroticus TaxID=68259 RepID=UPI001CBBC75D|nr:hypothetical protein [Streptomyces purpurogeneiscleroticus]MBZ4018032.1 hypothetical protein [Streptomyces purpurogeneiscleroticus]
MPDVHKMLRDLERIAVGINPETNAMPEGYFVSFRDVGLPISPEDYADPYNPIGINLKKEIATHPTTDPAKAPKTGSEAVDTDAELRAITKSQRAYVNTFLLTDKKLRMTNNYSTLPGSVSDSWWAIITGANGVPPKKDIVPELKAAYDTALANLQSPEGDPTPKYLRYKEYEAKYTKAQKAYIQAYGRAISDPKLLSRFPAGEGRILQDAIDDALDEWNSFGAKSEVEKWIATLAAQGTEPAIAMISRCKKRFENSLLNFPGVSNIPWVVMSPSNWCDPDNEDGWNVYTKDTEHTEVHYKSSSTSYGGGGGFNIGFWRAGGGLQHTENRESLNIQGSNLDISFKYSVVDIDHVGVDTSLLELKNWFLVGDYAKGSISHGAMAQERPSTGAEVFLPSIVTRLILVKDLTIKWDNWRSEWQEKTSSTDANVCVGWGPFALHGNYSHRSASRDFVADSEGEGLQSHGIQLVGYMSEILPESPKLNSSDFMK